MQDRIEELLQDPKETEYSLEQERRINDAWDILLKTRNGRVILKHLLEMTEYGVSAWSGSTEATLVNSGKQIIGERVMEQVNLIFPEAYALMMKEAKEDDSYDRSEQQSRAGRNTSTSTGNTNGQSDTSAG